MVWKSKYWYIPIALILILGYLVGGILWFGVQFLNYFPNVPAGLGREFLSIFLGGIIGGTIYCSWFFARDANEKLGGTPNKDGFPNFLDSFGYLLLIIGGGFTAIILVSAVKAGFLVLTSGQETTLTPEAIWVLSIGGGLGTQSVKAFLIRLVNKTVRQEGKQLSEPKPTKIKAQNAKSPSGRAKKN